MVSMSDAVWRVDRKEILLILLWQRFRPAVMIANHVQGFARCDRFAIVQNLVAKADRAPLRFDHSGANREQVVKPRRPLVAARGLCDDDVAVILCFHSFVLES